MHHLHRSLVDYDMAMLRALAESRGCALDTNVQTEAVDRLAQALGDPLSVRTAVARLSLGARDALAALLGAGGHLPAPRFTRQFGDIRHVGPGRLAREAPWQSPGSPAEELWYAGLIFRAFGQGDGAPADWIYVPDDVLPLLPPAEGMQRPFPVDTVVPDTAAATGYVSLVEDLFNYLALIQTREVRADAAGNLVERDRALLRKRAPWAGEPRLAFVGHLAARLGIVIRDPKEGVLRLETAPARQWLTATAHQQLATLQRAWRDDPAWNDLCHVPGLECDTETAWYRRYDPVAARRAVLALLARCPEEQWWSLASFVRAVKATDPDFQRPDGDYTGWYVRQAGRGEYLSGFGSWEQVEGALLADLCPGILSSLGIVSVAPALSADAGRAVACRITPAGRAFLLESLDAGQGADLEPSPPEAPPPVVVRPDFSIEVPLAAGLYTRFQLERLADAQGSAPRPASSPHKGMVYRYHLSSASLGRALARGIRADQVLAFLRQASADRVPANVAGQVQVWAERHGQVALQEVALLRVKSERAMRELTALPQTRALIDRQLSPTTALVRAEHLPQLRRVLRELGYLPPEE